MAIAAFHACLSMHIRKHLQEGFSFKQVPPLITNTIFSRGLALIVRPDKVSFVAAKTTVVRGPGDVMSVFPVTVQTIPDMAGSTVFFVKVWVGLSIGLFDEPPFPCPGGHGLIKEGVVSLMAADTAPGPIVTGRWAADRFRVIPMTRRARQSGMHPFERGMVGAC
jgi:hypothetical protein